MAKKKKNYKSISFDDNIFDHEGYVSFYINSFHIIFAKIQKYFSNSRISSLPPNQIIWTHYPEVCLDH